MPGFGSAMTHADGSLDDALPRGDDGRRLLAAQHRAGDFRRIGEMREACIYDMQAGLFEAFLQFALELAHDHVTARAQREFGVVVVVRVI